MVEEKVYRIAWWGKGHLGQPKPCERGKSSCWPRWQPGPRERTKGPGDQEGWNIGKGSWKVSPFHWRVQDADRVCQFSQEDPVTGGTEGYRENLAASVYFEKHLSPLFWV